MNLGQRIEVVDVCRLPLVNRFYAACQYPVKCGRQDRVYSYSIDENIIAAARLLPQSADAYLLRNLCVHPDYRRRGIARQFLAQLLREITPRNCYCYALPHLKGFYDRLNFVTLTASDVPQTIGDMYRRHCARKRGWILMGYISNSVANHF